MRCSPLPQQPIPTLKTASLLSLSVACLGATFSSLPWSVSQSEAIFFPFIVHKEICIEVCEKVHAQFSFPGKQQLVYGMSDTARARFTFCVPSWDERSWWHPSMTVGVAEVSNKPVSSVITRAYIPHSPLMHYLKAFIMLASNYFNSS